MRQSPCGGDKSGLRRELDSPWGQVSDRRRHLSRGSSQDLEGKLTAAGFPERKVSATEGHSSGGPDPVCPWGEGRAVKGNQSPEWQGSRRLTSPPGVASACPGHACLCLYHISVINETLRAGYQFWHDWLSRVQAVCTAFGWINTQVGLCSQFPRDRLSGRFIPASCLGATAEPPCSFRLSLEGAGSP